MVAGEAMALRDAQVSLSYSQLTDEVRQAANYLLTLGLESSERVAVYMEKRVDIVCALYLGRSAASHRFQSRTDASIPTWRLFYRPLAVLAAPKAWLVTTIKALCHSP